MSIDNDGDFEWPYLRAGDNVTWAKSEILYLRREVARLSALNDERIQKVLRYPDPDMERIMKEIAGEDGDSLHDVLEYVRGLKAEVEELRSDLAIKSIVHDCCVTHQQVSVLAAKVAANDFPIMPQKDWVQDVAWLGTFIDGVMRGRGEGG